MEKDKAIGKISAAISGLRDLDAILKIGLENTLSIINGEMGGIMLLDEATGTLSYRVTHNLSEKYAEEVRMKLGEGISGIVAKSGKARLIEDLPLEPDAAAHSGIVNAEGLHGMVSVPLRAKGKILGVMNIASHTPDRFADRDALILDSIGNQLGIAIEQANLYDQLKKSREKYRKLAQQALVAQEEGRRKLARELNDKTSPILSRLEQDLQKLVEISGSSGINETEVKTRLIKARDLSSRLVCEINQMVDQLRPTFSDTLGLIPAIRHYTETNLAPSGIKVTFEFDNSLSTFTPQIGTGLFRVIQGTISNIVQHSKAKKVIISLHREEDELVLQVVDDGIGFATSKITHIEESGRGAGLFSMKERTRLLGGQWLIESHSGKGTKVNVRVPIKTTS
jgi:signal transduction histidine kinase